MSPDALRQRVKRLMPQAKQDLARMVALKSVYDPRSRPPEDCDKMADLTIDLFSGVGLHEVRAYETSDGSKAICGHVPARRVRRRCCSLSTTTSNLLSARKGWVMLTSTERPAPNVADARDRFRADMRTR